MVQYSADGGTNWETLALDWAQPELAVLLDQLKGTVNARIRVIASDGFNSGTDASDNSFVVPNHPPDLAVLSPAPGELV